MTKTGKVTAKLAARTRFFLSIKRERKPPLQGANRPVGHGPRIAQRDTRRELRAEALRRLAYMLSGAVTLNSSRPFSSTVRVAVLRPAGRPANLCLPFTRQAL